jgi:hypothetical protein
LVTWEHGVAPAVLRLHHGATFDGGPIAQALVEGLQPVGSDRVIARGDVALPWPPLCLPRHTRRPRANS